MDRERKSETKKVICPSTLKIIHTRCFSNLRIKDIQLNEGLEKIGYKAFYQCPNLEKIKFPKTLRIIETEAFCYCYSLKDVNLDNLEKICNKAFFQTDIKKLEFGKNLNFLGDKVFSKCDIEKITVAPENPEYDSRNDCNAIILKESGSPFYKDNLLLFGCKNTIIPETIEEIKGSAFKSVDFNAETIKLPANVIINEDSFSECSFNILDARNVDIKTAQYQNRINDTFIVSDNKVYNGMCLFESPRNVIIDNKLDNFLENNTIFFEKYKDDSKFSSISLEDLINQGLSFNEANKKIKKYEDLNR